MTQLEFIRSYMIESNLTEDQLHEMGLIAVPCDCDADNCKGWAMISKENLKRHVDLYIKDKQ